MRVARTLRAAAADVAAAAAAAATPASGAAEAVAKVRAGASSFVPDWARGHRIVKMKGIRSQGGKRVYASVEPKHFEGLGWMVLLDDKVVVTPKERPLAVPSRALAEALCVEWDAQHIKIRPTSMPLLHLACNAIDVVPDERDKIFSDLRYFALNDTVLHRVKDPAALVKLQRKHWDPLVEWAAQKFDAKLFTDTAIRVVDQPEMSVQNLVGACRELDNFRLSVVDDVATVARSVIVSLALLHRRISPHEAYVCARLDEDWQMRTWGRVDGAFGHGIDVAYTRLKIYAARVFTTMLDDAKL